MKILTLLLMTASTALACGEISPQAWALTQETALRYGLEPELLAALVWQESRYCEAAVSPKGAIGLGQLMPGTATELGVDPYDPVNNLDGAACYLVLQWNAFQRWDLALAAYNAGAAAVEQFGGIPPFEETQSYVSGVLEKYRNFKAQTSEAVASVSLSGQVLESSQDVAIPVSAAVPYAHSINVPVLTPSPPQGGEVQTFHPAPRLVVFRERSTLGTRLAR